MKRLFLVFYLLGTSLAGFSQSTNISTFFKSAVEKADHFYDHFAYRNALEIYLHVNEKDKKNFYVRERIADCYFKLHDPISAEAWFDELVNEEQINSNLMFEYAEALSMNGRYDQSKEWFIKYLNGKPNDSLAMDKLNFLNDLDYYTSIEDRFLIATLDHLNTNHAEYGAHYFHNGIVFASSRDADLGVKHKPADAVHPEESLLNLFYVMPELIEEGKEPQHFHEEQLKTFFHEGPMAFYNNYRRGALTQSNINNGRGVRDLNSQVTLQIYFADVAHLGSLENITPFEHNHNEFSNAHPTFSPDGKLMYFSSTRNGGYGASDIYFSEFVNGHWTYPVNAGPEINTREDESFPFLSNDTTLFFSSNGHGTLGGLDMYVSYKRKGRFRQPVNIGYPANTRFDDFSLVMDSLGRNGYLASNRPGGKGLDDIYFFEAKYYSLVGTVRELSAEQPIIPNTLITVFNGNGDVIDTVTSNGRGIFRLDLPFDQDFIFEGKKEGYETLEGLKFSTKGKPYGVDSIMLPLWKHRLFAKGKIYDSQTEQPLKDAMVYLKNNTDGKVDSLKVGDDGRYSFLTVPNRSYEVIVKKDGFLPGGFKLNTKDLMEGDLLNDIVLEEVYLEKDLVLFGYKDWKLTPIALDQLSKLLRTLKKYSYTTVFIGAHADSRGSSEFNLDLSNKRAEITLEYFLKNGIDRKRIEAVGFGEELILNQCSNGVECPDEEHSKNRRAEVKVQKKE